jgi:hypothetical protein
MQSMKSTRLHETSCPVKRPESQIEPQSSKYRLYNVIDRFLSSFFSTRFTTERHRTPSNMAPGREFFCNCAEFCMRGGSTEPKSVSKSTYHRHSRHRNPIIPMPQFLAQHGIATPIPQAHSAAIDSAPCPPDRYNSITSMQDDLTRRRSHSPIAGPSEQSNKRQRPNEEDIVGSGLSRGESRDGQQEERNQLDGPIDLGFMQVQLHVRNSTECRIFCVNNADLAATSRHALRRSWTR